MNPGFGGAVERIECQWDVGNKEASYKAGRLGTFCG